MTTTDEKALLQLLRDDDEKGLRLIFDQYHKYLVVTAYNVLKDDARAKDLVQDVLFDLWKKRDELKLVGSLKSYLRRAVVNRCIDDLRSKKRLGQTEEITDFNQPSELASAQEKLEGADLQTVINQAIDSLPERCRAVFALSRFEELSHKEISEKLGISTKTIENQMTKALKILRAAVERSGLGGLIFWLINQL